MAKIRHLSYPVKAYLEKSSKTLDLSCGCVENSGHFCEMKTTRQLFEWLQIQMGCSTQKKFAEKVGVDLRTVGRWMDGSEPPSLGAQEKIAAAYGVELKHIHEYFKTGAPLPEPSDFSESDRILSGTSSPTFPQKLVDWFHRQSPTHQISVLEDIDEHEGEMGKARTKDQREQLGLRA